MSDQLISIPVIDGALASINSLANQATITGTVYVVGAVAVYHDQGIASTAAPLPVLDAAALTNLGSVIVNQGLELNALGTLTSQGASSVGVDHSGTLMPAGPGNSSTLVFNGSTLSLMATVAANPNRHSIEINNCTGSLAVVVLDDGNNTAGSVSLFPLVATNGPFQQGGDFTPTRETGRVRVYGSGTGYPYVREN